jgi:hypothetical protein
LPNPYAGDLFAECPVPVDKPLTTAVEPVIDSSRYFVLRIVDRDSQRHAFIGGWQAETRWVHGVEVVGTFACLISPC